MKKIILKNVTEMEIQILQNELYYFQDYLTARYKLPQNFDKFLDAIISIDIAFRLWFLFRSKIEKPTPKNGFTISLGPSEAATLLKCCLNCGKKDTHASTVAEKYKQVLDQQLKSL